MAGFVSSTKTKNKSQDTHQQGVRTQGRPLTPHLRAQMESRFGTDFSHVHIHTGPEAAAAAQAVHAQAYTVGRDIVFNNGRFAPTTSSGLQLLGHELAHVVQQQRGGTPPTLDSGSTTETAAAAAGRQVAHSSSPVTVAGSSGVGLARQEEDEPFWRRGLSGLQNATQGAVQSAQRKFSNAVETVRSVPDKVQEAARNFDHKQAEKLADTISPGPRLLNKASDYIAQNAKDVPLVGDKLQRAAATTRDLSQEMIQANREVTAGVLVGASPKKAIDTYVKKVDEVVKKGLNFVEEENYHDEASRAKEYKGVPVVGHVLGAKAAAAKFQSEITGGFVKAAWDIVPGLATMANHPLETARGLTEIPGFEQMMPMGTGKMVKAGVQGTGYLYDVHVEGQDPKVAQKRFLESQKHDPARDKEKLKQLWNGITQGYQESIKEKRYGEIPGRLLFDVGSFFIPGGAATKGPQAAGKGVKGLVSGGKALAEGSKGLSVGKGLAEGSKGLSIGKDLAEGSKGLSLGKDLAEGSKGLSAGKDLAEGGKGLSAGKDLAEGGKGVKGSSTAAKTGEGGRSLRALKGGGQKSAPRSPKLELIEGGKPTGPKSPKKPPSEPAAQAKTAVQEEVLQATGTDGPMVRTPSATPHRPKPTAVASQPPTHASVGGGGSRKPPRQGGSGGTGSSSGSHRANGSGRGSRGSSNSPKPSGDAVQLTREQQRQVEILQDFAEEQGRVSHGSPEHIADTPLSPTRKPAVGPQPKPFTRGNFAHENAELLIDEASLPRGLEAEVPVRLPDGSSIRPDRVDWNQGVFYEIRPNNPGEIANMERQRIFREGVMNQEFPLSGGKQWRMQIVTYSKERALEVLMEMGHSKPNAIEILKTYGFQF